MLQPMTDLIAEGGLSSINPRKRGASHLRRVRRRLGGRHGCPLERQPARHALAGDRGGVGSGGWAEAARQIRRWAPYEAYASKNRGKPWKL